MLVAPARKSMLLCRKEMRWRLRKSVLMRRRMELKGGVLSCGDGEMNGIIGGARAADDIHADPALLAVERIRPVME
ncbi:unnamed protein product [Heligmosomoides polygyrus]|uniref:Uncharacterized protein n=1 Tax=Heligmosomoides polygyrus TaxID=6339 RepID=A0A183GK20_HELPZ|nr:unnamed protein product [Heligmosomoides polygyrus]